MALQGLKPAEAARYDGVALGEVMLRIDPGDVPTPRARNARIWHGGGETNVAEGLAACFGLRTAVVTALVDDGIGRNIENQLREAGVDVSRIIWFDTNGKGRFATDQKGTLHNGINFTWAGKGLLPSVTEYYRAHTPIRELAPGDVDWDELFGVGVRWFHTGGIYNLISPTSSRLALEAVQAAGRHGTFRSYDLNYRSKVEPNKERAREINRAMIPHVDFLVGNQSDFDDSLGYVSDKVPKDAPFEIWLDTYARLLRRVASDYPNLKLIGTQLRGALTADRIHWGAVLYDTRRRRPVHGARARKHRDRGQDRRGRLVRFRGRRRAAAGTRRQHRRPVGGGARHPGAGDAGRHDDGDPEGRGKGSQAGCRRRRGVALR